MTPEERRHAYRLLVAAQIDVLMAGKALSQAALARRMETDRATVCRVLQGQEITVSTLKAFAEALDCDVVLRPRVEPDAAV